MYSDQHKKLLDSVLLDNLKLDGEVEVEEAIYFLGSLPVPLQHVQWIPNQSGNFAKQGDGDGKWHTKIRIVNPFDHDVPIVMGRSFLYTYRAIMDSIKGTTSTFDGICHQKFYVANVRNFHGESDSDDEEEYCLKRDEMGNPFYRPNHAKYLSCDDPMDRALTLQESLNPSKKIFVWKKAIDFLGSLPVPLQHVQWIPNQSGNFAKQGDGDGKWHAKIRIVNPCGNVFDQGYERKAT
ncbi:hypothetical protein Tco_0925956 [Tanacetum coccineum]|uniref:Uncharacterized protein n=1 Tax=Tanacetum coccineum TaxID=301880 RepID=A0ABQ5DAX2_9ASTR